MQPLYGRFQNWLPISSLKHRCCDSTGPVNNIPFLCPSYEATELECRHYTPTDGIGGHAPMFINNMQNSHKPHSQANLPSYLSQASNLLHMQSLDLQEQNQRIISSTCRLSPERKGEEAAALPFSTSAKNETIGRLRKFYLWKPRGEEETSP